MADSSCSCFGLTRSILFSSQTSGCYSWRARANSGCLRSNWLSERNGRALSAAGLSRSPRLNQKVVHVAAAWDELFHNQVLVSSSVAGILGQLSKPLTSVVYGKGFNLKLIIKSGGMPSTHSAIVTAAATAMGLERGLSDSLFGFSVIVAALFMYDAQGVRRAVGKQAEVINTLVITQVPNSQSRSTASSPTSPSPYAVGVELARDPIQAELKFMEGVEASSSSPKASRSTTVVNEKIALKVNGTAPLSTGINEGTAPMEEGGRTQQFFDVAQTLPSVKEGQVSLQEIGDMSGWRHIPLKESVGHTKLEVLVGAVWGIVITLALHPSFKF